MPSQLPEPSELDTYESPATPPWVRQYDLRFVPGFEPGPMNGPERDSALTKLWVRDRQPRPMDFLSLAAMCDCFFPRVYTRRQKHSPAGTVTLTTYFHCDEEMLSRVGAKHVLGVAKPLAFHMGYFDQQAEIWSQEGQLLASSHQMVYFKD